MSRKRLLTVRTSTPTLKSSPSALPCPKPVMLLIINPHPVNPHPVNPHPVATAPGTVTARSPPLRSTEGTPGTDSASELVAGGADLLSGYDHVVRELQLVEVAIYS